MIEQCVLAWTRRNAPLTRGRRSGGGLDGDCNAEIHADRTRGTRTVTILRTPDEPTHTPTPHDLLYTDLHRLTLNLGVTVGWKKQRASGARPAIK